MRWKRTNTSVCTSTGNCTISLQYVSKYDGRSVSGEVLYLLRRYIADFEEQHGQIELPDRES